MRDFPPAPPGLTHYWYWRIRKWHPERFGQPCRILARGKLNTVLVEFEDGYRMTTSRWFVRRMTPGAAQPVRAAFGEK